MQIIFESNTAAVHFQQESVPERLRFALRRMSSRIQKVKVRLDDINGPRGGVDKQCTVLLTGPESKPLVVRALAADWRQALDLAIARAGALLTKSVKRGQAGVKRNSGFSAKRMLPPAEAAI